MRGGKVFFILEGRGCMSFVFGLIISFFLELLLIGWFFVLLFVVLDVGEFIE